MMGSAGNPALSIIRTQKMHQTHPPKSSGLVEDRNIELSVVMPCFNEITHIEEVVLSWTKFLREEGIRFELIVVNDGSRDGCGRVLDRLRTEFNEIRIIHQLREGQERAVRRGFDEVRGKYVLQIDASLRYEPTDLMPLWEIREEFQLIVGNRTHRLDSLVRRSQIKIQAIATRILYRCPLKEPQLPFRLYHKDTLRRSMDWLPKNAESINVLLSVLMHRRFPGQVTEVPVPFRFSKGRKQTRRKRSSHMTRCVMSVWELSKWRYTFLKILKSQKVMLPSTN